MGGNRTLRGGGSLLDVLDSFAQNCANDTDLRDGNLRMHNSEILIAVTHEIADFVGNGDYKNPQAVDRFIEQCYVHLAKADFEKLSTYGPASLFASIERLSILTGREQDKVISDMGLSDKKINGVSKPSVK